MDFLTTNFNTELISTHYFYGPFRLLNLPIEVIFKILLFLDIPDLISLSRTCTLLKRLSNDRFLYCSRFDYTRDKIGISIQNRPSLDSLYLRHIVPSKSPNFNPNQFIILSMLTKSIAKDNLKKNLQRRPSLQELKEKNILKKTNANEFVQSKIKEFKKQNLASVLTVYVNSYKFQKQKPPSSTTFPSEQEYSSILNKFYNNLKKITPNPLKKSKSIESLSPLNTTATKFLNHYDQSTSSTYISNSQGNSNNDINNNTQGKRSISLDSKVYSKKQYFENLINNLNSGTTSEVKKEKPSPVRKPSRTLLRASIVNDCTINYEKVF